MTMRWMETLKERAQACKSGKYAFKDQQTEQDQLDYYVEQYLQAEEDLTIVQSDRIVNQIKAYAKALQERYPEIRFEF